MDKIRQALIRLVKQKTGIVVLPGDFVYPASSRQGDLALPCFSIAKNLKQAPAAIAQILAQKIDEETRQAVGGLIEKVEAMAGYLNFFFHPGKLASAILGQKQYAVLRPKKKRGKIMVEYISPNNNKPLHLGHLRNAFLGESVSRLLETVGYRVIRACLVNDRGVHIAKAMVAYERWGEKKGIWETPKSADVKGDQFVGNYYVLYSRKAKERPQLEEAVQESVRGWEAGEKKTMALWRKMCAWVWKGYQQTLKKIGIKFDKIYWENKFWREGKKIVLGGLKQGVFKQDEEGAIFAPLQKYGLPDKVLMRPDGTTIYATQDLALAKIKFRDFPNLGKSIYCVGAEQELYLKQLFKILGLLGEKNAQKCEHLKYELVNLPEGRMKSREGTTVDADDLIEKLEDYAAQEIRQRHDFLSEKEVAKRATAIALAALKYHLLQVAPESAMLYQPRESISFVGRTGPYLQYSHARICSILKKAGKEVPAGEKQLMQLVLPLEKALLLCLAKYPEAAQRAAKNYDPSELAKYLFDLAKIFSDFYETAPVLKAEEDVRTARLQLVSAVRVVLANGLEILGIEAPEAM